MLSKTRRYFPPIALLRESLRLRSGEYLRENTLHGFPYFVDVRRPLWERLAWFLCTLMSIVAILGTILTIWDKFQSDPILVGLDTETEDWVTDFPSVTVCRPDSELDFANVDGETAEQYASMYAWTWASTNDRRIKANLPKGETYTQIFNRASPDCQDLYDNCTYFGKTLKCEEMFTKVITSRGACCYARARQMTRETQPWALSFRSASYPLSIDLTESTGTWPPRDEPTWYYARGPLTAKISIIFTYSTEALKSITSHRRGCFLTTEYSSYHRCIQDCRRKRAMQTCECVPWFMTNELDAGKPVRPIGSECTRAIEYNCLRQRSVETNRNDRNCGQCRLSCNHTSYAVEDILERDDNVIEIEMSAWPSVLYESDVRFGWLDLLVSFGGIAGLFLGYSILTSVEFAYYFLLRTYCGAVLAVPRTNLEPVRNHRIRTSIRRVARIR